MKFYIRDLKTINIARDIKNNAMFVVELSLVSDKALNYEKANQLMKILLDNKNEVHIGELEEN